MPVGYWTELSDFFSGLPLWLGPLCALLAWAGLMIPHAWAQGDAKPLHILGMAVIGMTRLTLILAPLAWFEPTLLCYAPCGLLSGAAYWVGWRWLNGVTVINTNWLSIGSSWGELLTGLLAYGLPFAFDHHLKAFRHAHACNIFRERSRRSRRPAWSSP